MLHVGFTYAQISVSRFKGRILLPGGQVSGPSDLVSLIRQRT